MKKKNNQSIKNLLKRNVFFVIAASVIIIGFFAGSSVQREVNLQGLHGSPEYTPDELPINVFQAGEECSAKKMQRGNYRYEMEVDKYGNSIPVQKYDCVPCEPSTEWNEDWHMCLKIKCTKGQKKLAEKYKKDIAKVESDKEYALKNAEFVKVIDDEKNDAELQQAEERYHSRMAKLEWMVDVEEEKAATLKTFLNAINAHTSTQIKIGVTHKKKVEEIQLRYGAESLALRDPQIQEAISGCIEPSTIHWPVTPRPPSNPPIWVDGQMQ